MSEMHKKKDKNQHIQVFVRVRPANRDEIHAKSLTVVEVPSPREVIVRERPQDSKIGKKFTFDRAFGPLSKQLDVYNAVVNPLVDEVLAGYNCTVFAYGQTGTGKTYTMEGEYGDPTVHWQNDTKAGIIPRSLNHLFDELRTLEAQEYTVKVSFLELYNEELFDLLSSSDDASKIRLYEDTAKKGAVIIHGLEEVTVHNKNEVYKILEKGSEKRKTAATLMNAHSSRSHTIFSITVHIKENTMDGEELLKTGKLNLVDLAGSENVGRSGAVDRRAREAGNINQSLLTLGRVITALVERAPHIPYRESKLTRLLQESLGGRTKTSIIATVSPAVSNLDETLSTLDYAHRAKNITNRPEINQKLSKKALLKEYTEEIERLRRDLQATRERNGVYLAHDNYNELQASIEFQGKEIEEKINHIKALEEMMANNKNLIETLKFSLTQARHQIKVTEQEKNEQKHLVEKHVATEKKLRKQASDLLNVAEMATSDTTKLHEKIERKKRVEDENESLGQIFRDNVAKHFDNLNKNVSHYTQEVIEFSLSAKNDIVALTSTNSEEIETAIKCVSGDLLKGEREIASNLENNINTNCQKYETDLEDLVQNVSLMIKEQSDVQTKISTMLRSKIEELFETLIADRNHWRQISEENAKKLNNLSEHMRTTIGSICNKLTESENILKDKISISADRVNEMIAAQESMFRREEKFEAMFRACFAEYENVHEERKMVKDTVLTVSEEVLESYKHVEKHVDENKSGHCEINKFVNEDCSNGVANIRDNFFSDLETNWNSCNASLEQSKTVCEDLQSNVQENCQKLQSFNDEFSSKIHGIIEKIDGDKSPIISSINGINKLVSDISISHEEFLQAHRRKIETTGGEICRKLENQSVKSSEWNNEITSHLRTTQHQVDKFIVEDMRKDVPTGTTPAKRQFDYPKQLVATSPHERIIQRFREMRNEHEVTQDEDSTLLSIDDTLTSPLSPRSNGVESAKSLESLSVSTASPAEERPDRANVLVKCASTSDLALVTRNLSKEMQRSTSDVTGKKENKENTSDNFLKPMELRNGKTSKLKHPVASRRVLTSKNEQS